MNSALEKSQALGWHYLVEFSGCNSEVLDSESLLRGHLLEAVALSEATIIKDVFHKFSPQGVTGVVVIAESHVAVHTWPEFRYAAIDIFTCTQRMKVDVLIESLKTTFEAGRVEIKQVVRGTV